jgi:hypothetical protein
MEKIRVPREFSRGRLRDFYIDGFMYGDDVGHDWTMGPEQEDTVQFLRRRDVGEMIGEWLSSYQQYADTIYYDKSVTERQIEAWEEGLHEGIMAVLKPWAAKRGIEV